MLYREIIAVCSEIHTKHINTRCGQNIEFVNVKLAVHIVTTGLQRFKPGRIILRWIFRKWNVVVWTGSSWLRVGTGDGHL